MAGDDSTALSARIKAEGSVVSSFAEGAKPAGGG